MINVIEIVHELEMSKIATQELIKKYTIEEDNALEKLNITLNLLQLVGAIHLTE